LKVLHIEDNPIQVRLAGRAVRHLGGDFRSATTAEEALQLLNTETFTVIVCDLVLPDMHGTNLIQRIRAKLPDVPIIVMTGDALSREREACLALGITDFLLKPIEDTALQDALRKYMSAADG